MNPKKKQERQKNKRKQIYIVGYDLEDLVNNNCFITLNNWVPRGREEDPPAAPEVRDEDSNDDDLRP